MSPKKTDGLKHLKHLKLAPEVVGNGLEPPLGDLTCDTWWFQANNLSQLRNAGDWCASYPSHYSGGCLFQVFPSPVSNHSSNYSNNQLTFLSAINVLEL